MRLMGLICCLALLAGCASTGTARGEQAATGVQYASVGGAALWTGSMLTVASAYSLTRTLPHREVSNRPPVLGLGVGAVFVTIGAVLMYVGSSNVEAAVE